MLSGKEIDDLTDLLSSTLNLRDLERYVHASTGDRLFVEFVSPGLPLETTIFELLSALELRGLTAIFLVYVYDKRPQRPDVRAKIVGLFPDATAAPGQKIELSAQTAGAPQVDAPTNAIAPGLQRNVRPNLAHLDIEKWQTRLMQVQSQVCRLEQHGSPISTGFLVGPDTVLTAWHSVEAANKAGNLDTVACRFDFASLPDGAVQQGQVFKVQAGGCIDFSPYSAADIAASDNSPTAAELDYALLRLTARAGEQPVKDGTRGWITLPESVPPLPADSPILIVQHPLGRPMKLAMDTEAVIGFNANGTRIRYRTKTEDGSAGSPVFTMDWDIVAMHHARDPSYSNPAYRQGVPIDLIRRRIESNGFGAVLGA